MQFVLLCLAITSRGRGGYRICNMYSDVYNPCPSPKLAKLEDLRRRCKKRKKRVLIKFLSQEEFDRLLREFAATIAS